MQFLAGGTFSEKGVFFKSREKEETVVKWMHFLWGPILQSALLDNMSKEKHVNKNDYHYDFQFAL